MYDLGEQFAIDYSKAKPNEDSVIKGNKYRITILTERLIRFEYNEEGIFEDRPTELVWYRNLPKPTIQLEEDLGMIVITTSYFKLQYIKEREFNGGKLNPTKNLKVSLVGTDKVWYFDHPEIRNYGASDAMEENTTGKIKFTKGLYSIDGFVSIDDSKSAIILENGQFEERKTKSIDTYLFMYKK